MIDSCNEFLRAHYRDCGVDHALVLDAGGGSVTHFALPPGARLLCVDLSRDELGNHPTADLRVQSDLHALPIADGAVHVAFCFNVLEHLDDPAAAVRGLIDALAPGGILVLGCPNRDGLKGLVTWLTPIGFHAWYTRALLGRPLPVFPTPFRSLVRDAALRPFVTELGLEVLFYRSGDALRGYGITAGSWRRRLLAVPYYALGALATVLSLGRWRALRSDLLLVARKSAIRAALPRR